MFTYNAFQLAAMADCGEPDSRDSVGAGLLLGVQDAVNDLIDAVEERGGDVDDVDSIEDDIYAMADDAPSVYTHRRMCEFVDLCAYREDVSEYGAGVDDLEKLAGVALYMIAERLARELWGEYLTARAERDDSDDSGDD